MQIKHIYWFSPNGLIGPSIRYRAYYPLNYFNKYFNITNDFFYPQRNIKGIIKFIKLFFSILIFRKKNSIIVIQKIWSNNFYSKALQILIWFQRKNTLYDIDDAEYLRHDTKAIHHFLRKCNAISVGSEELKKYCLNFNENIFVLTSPVLEHNELKTKRNKILNIGWVGDFGDGRQVSKEFSHKNNMYKILFPQIIKINFPIKFTIIGVKKNDDIPQIKNYFKDFNNIELDILEELDWVNDSWVYSEISKFDVGVSPLTNHLYNKSKSAFKAKQYLSAGVPTIASDVGENSKFVLNNINGFLCKTSDGFFSYIVKFNNMNDNDYFRMSKNAFKYKEEYSMGNYCRKILEFYKDVE